MKTRQTIRDTGKGIDPEFIDQVIEPFFTTRKFNGGIGPGLSNAFGMVKTLHGNICVDRYPGQGVSFIMALPVTQPEQT
jgi:two-component system, NtrC family, sensor kinase